MGFDPKVYSVSEEDSFAQLTIRASLAASFAYNVTMTTADNSATGKFHADHCLGAAMYMWDVCGCAWVWVLHPVCAYVCLCMCVAVGGDACLL